MKNKMKLLGIIAIVALIGFSMAACDTPAGGDGGGGGGGTISIGSTNGELTINGLGSYNGKYIIAIAETTHDAVWFWAFKNITGNTEATVSITGAAISGGDSEVLKVWKLVEGTGLVNYNGNDEVFVRAIILNKSSINSTEFNDVWYYAYTDPPPDKPSFVHAVGIVGTGSPDKTVTFASGKAYSQPFTVDP